MSSCWAGLSTVWRLFLVLAPGNSVDACYCLSEVVSAYSLNQGRLLLSHVASEVVIGNRVREKDTH